MKHIFLLLSLAGLFFSCQPSPETTSVKTYYDLKGFLEKQVIGLNKQKPSVLKETKIGNSKDQKTTNAIDWNKELEIFLQTDLNKPAYKLSYVINRPDSTTYEYRLKDGEKMTVKYLKISVGLLSKQIEKLEAVVKQSNQLYHSEKQLLFTCAPAQNGQWQIKTYEVSGFQQLAMAEKKTFSVKGIVLGK